MCRGFDDEEVKEGDAAKSMLAFKSFSPIPKPCDESSRWLRVLSDEIAERLVFERDANGRLPNTITLHFRSRSGGGSRSAPILAGALMDGAPDDSISGVLLKQAESLLAKAGAEAFPCKRLALGASNFKPVTTESGRISHFFSSAPAGVVAAASVAVKDGAEEEYCASDLTTYARGRDHAVDGHGGGGAGGHGGGNARDGGASKRGGARGETGSGSIEAMFAKQGAAGKEERIDQRWEEGMSSLEAMGFERVEATRQALASAGGEVAGAIEILVGGGGAAMAGKAVAGKKRGPQQKDIASMFAKQQRR